MRLDVTSQNDDTTDSDSTVTAEVRALIEREMDEVFSTLNAQDAVLPIVLRMHLYIESLLERLIVTRLPRGDRLVDKGRLTFAQKLELVHALDVVPDANVGAIRKLNALRNSLSHQRQAVVTTSQIEEIGRPLGRQFRQTKREAAGDLLKLSRETLVDVCEWVLVRVIQDELDQTEPPNS